MAGTNFADLLIGTGGNDTLIGLGGNDTLIGLGGNDTLRGGSGNDVLNGGTGVDNLDGGDGDDTYIVDNVLDVASEVFGDALGGIDTVQASVSYTLSTNLENLTLTGTAAINGTGNAKNNVINGNSGNNVLSGLDGNDQLNGGAGNDTLNGGAGNDTLRGGSGNDVLNGGTGVDNLDGGDGDDTYIVDNVFDVASEVFGDALGGIDTVQASVSYTLSTNLENLTLTGTAAINGTGNAKNNVINGNSGNNVLSGLDGNDQLNGGAGNDTLRGGSGNDVLNGGTGADNLDGGDGNDIYIVDNVFDVASEVFGDALGGIDTVQASVSYTLSTNLENLTLTGVGAINGTGNAKNNIINGNSANNVISGLNGDDNLNGNGGNDTLRGGSGNDVLNGGTGADNLDGGDGNDIYIVDNVFDVASEVFGDALGGIDTVQASVSYTLSTNLENLTLTGVGAINGTGNAKNNVINGNSGNNVLSGLDGNDIINGGAGNDSLFGGNGNDTLNGGAGNDILTGGGDGQIDVLTSGSLFDRDTFVLGTGGIFGSVLYDSAGNNDFARITDFDLIDFIGEPANEVDKIQLRGTASDYRLVNGFTIGGFTGVGIFDRNSTINLLDDDLIGLVQGVTAGNAFGQLNLSNATQFNYV
ncbi:hypothetical protein A6S26_30610 [Nostoc sp. ATCC 43529]|nr:hypothetical protein A6S26_30610 [Nostoc sp. ATCC 43529]